MRLPSPRAVCVVTVLDRAVAAGSRLTEEDWPEARGRTVWGMFPSRDYYSLFGGHVDSLTGLLYISEVDYTIRVRDVTFQISRIYQTPCTWRNSSPLNPGKSEVPNGNYSAVMYMPFPYARLRGGWGFDFPYIRHYAHSAGWDQIAIFLWGGIGVVVTVWWSPVRLPNGTRVAYGFGTHHEEGLDFTVRGLKSPSGSYYDVIIKDGTRYRFGLVSQSGPAFSGVQKIISPHGSVVEFCYGYNGNAYVLERVDFPDGSYVLFNHEPGSPYVSSVSLTLTGETIVYEDDTAPLTPWAIFQNPPGNLDYEFDTDYGSFFRVIHPGGLNATYYYDCYGYGYILKAVLPSGAVVGYSYSSVYQYADEDATMIKGFRYYVSCRDRVFSDGSLLSRQTFSYNFNDDLLSTATDTHVYDGNLVETLHIYASLSGDVAVWKKFHNVTVARGVRMESLLHEESYLKDPDTFRLLRRNITLGPNHAFELFAYDDWGNVVYHRDFDGHEEYFCYHNGYSDSSMNYKFYNWFGEQVTLFTDSFQQSDVGVDIHDSLAGYAYVIDSDAGLNFEEYYKANADGDVVEAWRKAGGQWAVTSIQYNEYGLVSQVTTPMGRSKRFYYQHGTFISKVEVWNGTSWVLETRKSVQPWTGLVYWEEDVYGRRITYTYDQMGRVTSVTAPDGNTTYYVYDGNSKEVVDPAGGMLRYEYDEWGRLERRLHYLPNGTLYFVEQYGYDYRDLKTYEAKFGGGVSYLTTYHYRSDGSPSYEEYTDGTVTYYLYSREELKKEVHLPWGYPVVEYYSVGGRLLRVERGLRVVQYYYTDSGLLSRVVDPLGQEYTYQYDDQGRLILMQGPGVYRQWTYNLDGDVTSYTNANGETTTFHYDAQGRLTEKVFYDGSKITFSYYMDGRVRRVSRYDSSGYLENTITYTYDACGRVETKTWSIYPEGLQFTYVYGYDARGLLSSIMYPNGLTVSIGRDGLGRIATVNTSLGVEIKVSYRHDDRPLTILLSQGRIRLDYAYDQMGRVTDFIVSVGGTQVFQESYTYNDVGLLVSSSGTRGSWEYGYNEWHELTSASSDTLGYSYQVAYDWNGNRYWDALNGEVRQYVYSGDRLLRVEDSHGDTIETYTYDAEGHVTRIEGERRRITPIEYTPDGLLARAGDVLHCWYDGEGNRVKYSEQRTPLVATPGPYRYEHPLNISTCIILGLVAYRYLNPGFERYYYIPDPQGNVRLILRDVDGVLKVEEVDYDPYGNILVGASNNSPPQVREMLFKGKRLEKVGLYFYPLRAYDPLTGRFTAPDPDWSPGKSPYQYPGNNPLLYHDPLGAFAIPAAIAAAGYLLGFLATYTQYATDYPHWVALNLATKQTVRSIAVDAAVNIAFTIAGKGILAVFEVAERSSGISPPIEYETLINELKAIETKFSYSNEAWRRLPSKLKVDLGKKFDEAVKLALKEADVPTMLTTKTFKERPDKYIKMTDIILAFYKEGDWDIYLIDIKLGIDEESLEKLINEVKVSLTSLKKLPHRRIRLNVWVLCTKPSSNVWAKWANMITKVINKELTTKMVYNRFVFVEYKAVPASEFAWDLFGLHQSYVGWKWWNKLLPPPD